MMTETKKPHVYLTDRFFSAMAYATAAHKEQVRKSTDIAYISHPFGVASLVIEAGGDEDQAIAGLLHDVAEDCGGEERLTEIAELFGDRVAQIVRGCSDSLVVDEEKKAPWKERKEAHIKHLKSADLDTLLVTAADKTHNARAIATDIQSIGNKVWDRFNSDKQSIVWYYNSIYQVLSESGVTASLLNPLRSAIAVMKSSNEFISVRS
jgi:(p)ppGpp synthase/HD superfamily hydrolase